MMSLFSSFDVYYFSISLLMLPSIMLFLNSVYGTTSISGVINQTYPLLENFFLSLKPLSFNKFFTFLCFSLMCTLMLINLAGVFPYGYALTSQLSLILFLSLLLWGSILVHPLVHNLKGMLSHFIPEGTPIYLTWFLFLIEITSNLIRPLTLTVRLMANILAGHLLMILLFKMVYSSELIFPMYLILNLVELFVAGIQAYIFITMICLYYSES